MTNEDFSRRLMKARVQAEMSQVELAKLAGIAPAQISRYEAASARPRPHILAKLAKALLVDADWLANGDDPLKVSYVDLGPGNGAEMTVEMTPEVHSRFEEVRQRAGLGHMSESEFLHHLFLIGMEAKLAELHKDRLPSFGDIVEQLAEHKRQIEELKTRVKENTDASPQSDAHGSAERSSNARKPQP